MNETFLNRLFGNDPKRAIERLLATGPGQVMLDELEGERLDERRRLCADLERLDAAARADLARIEEAQARAGKAHAEALAAVQRAEADLGQARWALEAHLRSERRARERITARLEATADRQVREFLAWLDEQRAAMRKPRHAAGGDSAATDRLLAKLGARAKALDHARRETAKLIYSPASAVEIGETIARLRAALPADPGGVVGQVAALEERLP